MPLLLLRPAVPLLSSLSPFCLCLRPLLFPSSPRAFPPFSAALLVVPLPAAPAAAGLRLRLAAFAVASPLPPLPGPSCCPCCCWPPLLLLSSLRPCFPSLRRAACLASLPFACPCCACGCLPPPPLLLLLLLRSHLLLPVPLLSAPAALWRSRRGRSGGCLLCCLCCLRLLSVRPSVCVCPSFWPSCEMRLGRARPWPDGGDAWWRSSLRGPSSETRLAKSVCVWGWVDAWVKLVHV